MLDLPNLNKFWKEGKLKIIVITSDGTINQNWELKKSINF